MKSPNSDPIDLDEVRAAREEYARRLEDAATAHAAEEEPVIVPRPGRPAPVGNGPPKDVTRVPPKRGKKKGRKAAAHAPFLPRNQAKVIRDGRKGTVLGALR